MICLSFKYFIWQIYIQIWNKNESITVRMSPTYWVSTEGELMQTVKGFPKICTKSKKKKEMNWTLDTDT